MNYQEVLDYMNSIAGYGIVPGLESIQELCRRIGSPQQQLKFVHIAGTNGKGSTLAYVSSICMQAGYRVGCYISPTIFDYRERFQINGKMVPKTVLCRGMELIKEQADKMAEDGLHHPTPFEIETAFAFWYFAEKKCDLVVLETGMGGLLDATNVIRNTEVVALASISMDHMQFLGKTLEEIAFQKAGIIKEKCRVVSVRQQNSAMDVVRKIASEKNSSLCIADLSEVTHIKYGIRKQSFDYHGYHKLEISLIGKYQIQNAILAINVIENLRMIGYEISDQALRSGLQLTQWLGRFSVIQKNPLFIVDGAHNEDAARQLAASIEEYLPNRRIIYIMGVLKDKEYEKVIQLTSKYADAIITVTSPDNPRALSAFELAKAVSESHANVTAVDSLEEAVEISQMMAGKDDVILAFGSLSYLGKLINIVQKN